MSARGGARSRTASARVDDDAAVLDALDALGGSATLHELAEHAGILRGAVLAALRRHGEAGRVYHVRGAVWSEVRK